MYENGSGDSAFMLTYVQSVALIVLGRPAIELNPLLTATSAVYGLDKRVVVYGSAVLAPNNCKGP